MAHRLTFTALSRVLPARFVQAEADAPNPPPPAAAQRLSAASSAESAASSAVSDTTKAAVATSRGRAPATRAM